jgi:hypothetical protein
VQGYLRPGFVQEHREREIAKLDAILQALNNCYRALGTIRGGEAVHLAAQDIASAYEQVAALRKEKSRASAEAPADVLDVALADEVDEEDWKDA